jgi:predicted NAD-dependent protein-ADP-ribosyltransferase YbiA (DUF1768 family)
MAANALEVGSKGGYPAGELSNFTAHDFELDFVECASMEGFLQALKFDKTHIQVEVCKLTGAAAKKRGADRNSQWKLKRGLWWQGEFYERKSDEYQRLLDRAYIAMAKQSEKFRKALLDSGDLILTHRTGKSAEFDTVLTQSEFCNRLMKLRNILRKGTDLNTVKKL